MIFIYEVFKQINKYIYLYIYIIPVFNDNSDEISVNS